MPLPPVDDLPAADRVLAVCAHPDDESFGLGGVLGAYAGRGAHVAVLSLTRGEASTLGSDIADLAGTRATELEAGATHLGVSVTRARDYPDGALDAEPLEALVDEVIAAVDAYRPQLMLVFHPDGITGHSDHRRATEAARLAAARRALPVWCWYVTDDVASHLNAEFGAAFVGTTPKPGDRLVRVDHDRQRRAVRAHASQAASFPVVERRLELCGDHEPLRPLAEIRSR